MEVPIKCTHSWLKKEIAGGSSSQKFAVELGKHLIKIL